MVYPAPCSLHRSCMRMVITYMRTDSVNLSNTALGDITNTVKSMYGEEYHQFRKYKNKTKAHRKQHEAIRPTYMSNANIQEAEWARLYELIWKRTMACQMADAELERQQRRLKYQRTKELTASGEVLKFDGFLKVYREDKDEWTGRRSKWRECYHHSAWDKHCH